MSTQSLLTPSLVTKDTLEMLENNLVFASRVNRQYEGQFAKIGSTITVRKPNRYRIRSGPGISIQNITEPSTSITISNQKGVDFQFSSQDLTLTIEEFSDRYLKTAAAEVANVIDVDLAANFNQIFNEVGTPGTVPNNYSFLAAVGQRMDEGAVPQDGRTLVLNPAAHWALASALSVLFVRSVAEPALKGYLAAIANFEIFLDQNILVQTVGAYGGTAVVNGANQTGGSLVTNGWSASVNGLLNVGDVFTIDGVNAINPKSRNTTGALQNFVVTTTVNSDSGGNATIQMNPSITTSGAYQTVSGSPANLSRVRPIGTASTTYAQNLGFVRDCFGLVVVPIEVPMGVDFGARETYKNISIRIVRAFDINNDVTPCRLDVLYGTSTFYPELGCRLTN